MRKRNILFVCLSVGCTLLIGIVIWVSTADRVPEPTYQGRKLSVWVDLSVGGDQKANKAIHEMGTNTFPTVLRWLHSNPSPWKARILWRFPSIPSWIKPWLADPGTRAPRVIGILGKEAAPMAYDLFHLGYDKSQVIAERSLTCLHLMDMQGVPYLILVVRDHQNPYRKHAVRLLGALAYKGKDESGLFSQAILVECMADPAIQAEATMQLVQWTKHKLRFPTDDTKMVEDFKRRVSLTNELFRREFPPE
jgi:hypothetical protein